MEFHPVVSYISVKISPKLYFCTVPWKHVFQTLIKNELNNVFYCLDEFKNKPLTELVVLWK